ncbi:hypothetical protein M1O17_05920 [Dehalococcoidia bacterium]|nr:hypothetical protein [Dehalococcoidia bacterium]MCL0076376.1 hypothetical protein [Dehalococcoidia bacterium]
MVEKEYKERRPLVEIKPGIVYNVCVRGEWFVDKVNIPAIKSLALSFVS